MECIVCWSKLKSNQIELNCSKCHKLCNECQNQTKPYLEEKQCCPSDTTCVDTIKIYKEKHKPKTIKLTKKTNQEPKDSSLLNIDDLKNNLKQCKLVTDNFESICKNIKNKYISSNKENIIYNIRNTIKNLNKQVNGLQSVSNDEQISINKQIQNVLNELEYNNMNSDVIVNYYVEDGQIIEIEDENQDNDYNFNMEELMDDFIINQQLTQDKQYDDTNEQYIDGKRQTFK